MPDLYCSSHVGHPLVCRSAAGRYLRNFFRSEFSNVKLHVSRSPSAVSRRSVENPLAQRQRHNGKFHVALFSTENFTFAADRTPPAAGSVRSNGAAADGTTLFSRKENVVT